MAYTGLQEQENLTDEQKLNEYRDKITAYYKRLEEIDTELHMEYDEFGETDYAAQLEVEYERIENEICRMESFVEKNDLEEDLSL